MLDTATVTAQLWVSITATRQRKASDIETKPFEPLKRPARQWQWQRQSTPSSVIRKGTAQSLEAA